MNGKLRITSSQYVDDGGHEKLYLTFRFADDTAELSFFSSTFRARLDELVVHIATVAKEYRTQGNLITCDPMATHVSVTGINMGQKTIESFMNSLRKELESYEIEIIEE